MPCDALSAGFRTQCNGGLCGKRHGHPIPLAVSMSDPLAAPLALRSDGQEGPFSKVTRCAPFATLDPRRECLLFSEGLRWLRFPP